MARTKGSRNRKKTITKGLGDVVEQAIKATGLDKFVDGKDCGCDKRKELLNNVIISRAKVECFTEDEYQKWGEFKKVRTLKITDEQIKLITTLHSKTFNKPLKSICRGCGGSASMLLRMIEQLDKVHEVYDV